MIPPGQRLGYRLIQGMAIDDARPLGDGHNLLSRHAFHSLNPPARPPDFQAIHHRRAPQAEM